MFYYVLYITRNGFQFASIRFDKLYVINFVLIFAVFFIHSIDLFLIGLNPYSFRICITLIHDNQTVLHDCFNKCATCKRPANFSKKTFVLFL
jgi:hypothetical protein